MSTEQYPYVTPVTWEGQKALAYRVAISPDNVSIIMTKRFPLAVSYHGDSTILVAADGRWVTGQVPRHSAEQIAKEINAKVL